MKIPILKLSYTEEDIRFIKDEIESVLRSGLLTMDSRVRTFEEQFAAFCGVKYALGTNSGTSSLEIILRAIGVEGKTVVMPSNTYMATPLAAIKAGAKVIFTECERSNLQMDSDDLKKKISERKIIYDHGVDQRKPKWRSEKTLTKIDLKEMPEYLQKNYNKYSNWLE